MAELKPELQLIGLDGNAFGILARARKVALKNGMDWNTIQADAQSGDYDHLLQVIQQHFDVC